jgi:hypothetical protein
MWDQACEGMLDGEAVRWAGWWGRKAHWGALGGVEGDRDVGRRRVAVDCQFLSERLANKDAGGEFIPLGNNSANHCTTIILPLFEQICGPI